MLVCNNIKDNVQNIYVNREIRLAVLPRHYKVDSRSRSPVGGGSQINGRSKVGGGCQVGGGSQATSGELSGGRCQILQENGKIKWSKSVKLQYYVTDNRRGIVIHGQQQLNKTACMQTCLLSACLLSNMFGPFKNILWSF